MYDFVGTCTMLWYRMDLNRIYRYIPPHNTGIYFPPKVYTSMYLDVQTEKSIYEIVYLYTIQGTFEYIVV